MANAHHHGDAAHGTKQYIVTYIKLLILTGITVTSASFIGGDTALWVTMVISTMKGWLVISVFMHLIDEDPLCGLVLAASFVFLALFFTFTSADWGTRKEVNPEADTYALRLERAEKIQAKLAAAEAAKTPAKPAVAAGTAKPAPPAAAATPVAAPDAPAAATAATN